MWNQRGEQVVLALTKTSVTHVVRTSAGRCSISVGKTTNPTMQPRSLRPYPTCNQSAARPDLGMGRIGMSNIEDWTRRGRWVRTFPTTDV